MQEAPFELRFRLPFIDYDGTGGPYESVKFCGLKAADFVIIDRVNEVTAANLRLGHQVYDTLLGQRPRLALLNEQAYSAGLVPLYLEAGYQAIIMEWNNPARGHPDWDPEWRYLPQQVQGPAGERLPLIWNKSIAFQKFQRYAHGELELDELLDYVRSHRAERPRALPLFRKCRFDWFRH